MLSTTPVRFVVKYSLCQARKQLGTPAGVMRLLRRAQFFKTMSNTFF